MFCQIIDLGQIDYSEAYRRQKDLLLQVYQNQIPGALLILEHFPVITLGRSARKENILTDRAWLEKNQIAVCAADRGGDVTLHLPGQLIAYPIFDLNQCGGRDVHKFLRNLELAAIDFLSGYGISAKTISGLTGVWVKEEKIAAIGVAFSKWISYHGLSVNVDPDMSLYAHLNPCGLDNRKVTSVARLTNTKINCQDAKRRLVASFQKIFNLQS